MSGFLPILRKKLLQIYRKCKRAKGKMPGITGDARSDRSDEKWLNLILIRG